MPVNRYELPAQQQVANTYVDLPYKELLLAGQAQQAEYDKIEASRNEWANKEWNNLSPDDEMAKAKKAWLESETSKIADLWGKDPRQARQAYKTFEREAVKEFGKFGSIGAMEANYNARAAYEKQIDESINKDINNPVQKAKMMAAFDEEYAKNKGIGNNATGNWNKYNTEDAVKWINPTEWANDKGKGFEANLNSFANVTLTDNGYIYTDKSTGEVLSPEEIREGLTHYYKGDPELQAMINQGTKYGYASIDMLVDAVKGAEVKYGYSKNTRDKDIKGDPNYQYNDTKKREEEANKVIHLQDSSAYFNINDGEGVTNIYKNVIDNQKKINTSIENLKKLDAEISSYVTENPDGTFTVKPGFELNYNDALRKKQNLESDLTKSTNKQSLEQDILHNAIGEVMGIDANNIQSVDYNNYSMIVDNTKLVMSFEDSQGNIIPVNTYNSGASSVMNDKDLQAYMSKNNLKPIYQKEKISIKNSVSAINSTVKERSAKAEDMTLTFVTDKDFKDSPQLQAIEEDIQNGMESFSVYVIDPATNKMVNTKQNLQSFYDGYANGSFTTTMSVLQKIKSGEITQEEGDVYLASIKNGNKVKGRTEVNKNGGLVAITDDSSFMYQLPNGQTVLLKPNETIKPSLTTATENAGKQMYAASGDLASKQIELVNKYPEVYKEAKELTKDFSVQKTGQKESVINTKPLIVKDIYNPMGSPKGYIHTAKTDVPGTLHIWVSTSSEKEDSPGANSSQSTIIQVNDLPNVVLQINENLNNL